MLIAFSVRKIENLFLQLLIHKSSNMNLSTPILKLEAMTLDAL